MVKLRTRHSSPKVQVSRPLPKVRDVVEVLWEDRGEGFRGRLVKRLRPKDNLFLVCYDDGDEIWHDLDEHYWRHAGDKDWVTPAVLWDVESHKVDAGSKQTPAKRKRVSHKARGPKHISKSAAPSRKSGILKDGSAPPKRTPRKQSEAGPSCAKQGTLRLKIRLRRSSFASQSEVSTQLSFSKGSTNDTGADKEQLTPAVTADTQSQAVVLTANEPVYTKRDDPNFLTVNSVDSNDQRFPPRKRTCYLRA